MSYGMVYVLCDICGQKVRQRDTELISDKYSSLNGFLVCKRHNVKENPQYGRPLKYGKEKLVENPKFIRSEPTDTYITNANSDRAPSAPRYLTATVHPLNDTVYLQWQGPLDSGSSPITGYVITRAEPQESAQFIINSNTNSQAIAYEDTDTDAPITGEYTYTVRAINEVGTSPDSNLAYFPADNSLESLGLTQAYLVTSTDLYTLKTGAGEYILVNL